jgi:hypothetical protein
MRTAPLCRRHRQVEMQSLEGRRLLASVVALTSDNQLLQFNTADTKQAVSVQPITGLAAGEQLVGIDYRPANGMLYGVGTGDGGRIYTIDPSSGAATLISTLSADLSGTEFGVDFNPTVDRLRIVSDADQNLRVNVDTGATTVDVSLAYNAADANAGANPNIVGAAYTNSFAGATTTTLYDIDSSLGNLVTQLPPNNGTLNTVGSLGVGKSTGDLVGFDIGDSSPTFAGDAYASFSGPAGKFRLYQIDLATGQATDLGKIASKAGGKFSVRDIAVAPQSTSTPSAARAASNEAGAGSDDAGAVEAVRAELG